MKDETREAVRRTLAGEDPDEIMNVAERLEAEELFSDAEEWRKWYLHLRPADPKAQAALDACRNVGKVLEDGRDALRFFDTLAGLSSAPTGVGLKARVLQTAIADADAPRVKVATVLLRDATDPQDWFEPVDTDLIIQLREKFNVRPSPTPRNLEKTLEDAEAAEARSDFETAEFLWENLLFNKPDEEFRVRLKLCRARLEAERVLEVIEHWCIHRALDEASQPVGIRGAQLKLRKVLEGGGPDEIVAASHALLDELDQYCL